MKKGIKNRNVGGSTVMYLCLLGNFARLHSRFMARFRFHFAPRFVYLLASRICARDDVTSRFVLLRCYHPDLSIVLLRRDGGMEMITRCEIQTSLHKLTSNFNIHECYNNLCTFRLYTDLYRYYADLRLLYFFKPIFYIRSGNTI